MAQQGIENLRVSAPFVLSMLSDIEEITLEATGENYKYSRQYNCGLANSLVHEIIYVSSTETKKIYILNLTEENTTISIALEGGESGWYIMPYAKQQSRLFCDFPLIGTEDFPFPVLVCARDFNPTEPRDGIFLTCQSRSKIDDEIQQNRDIIERACELYKKLLEYVAEKRWNGIYNITKINSYGSKNWYDNEWLEDIVNNCKYTILHTPIICTGNGSMMALQDDFEYEQVFIISESKEEIREKEWDLLSVIMPEKIPCREDMHKPVWQCMNATKNGIKNCPHCKAIDEAILEGAFLEAFGLLAGNFDDVLDIVMSNVEEALNNAEDVRKKQQLDKDISSLESKKSRMTDMLIDGTISKEVYDEKVLEFTRKLHTLSERRYLLEESINKQKDVGKQMSALRETLISEQVLDEFDRVVFESIIEKVLVGGFDEEGNPDPYKLTFVLKGNQSGIVPNAKEHYKAIQKELKKGNKVS